MSSILNRGFFEKPTLTVARQLLSCNLVRIIDGQKLAGRIVETEAYIGPKDLASHASRGRTPRTEIMFGAAGRAYIYFIYGMYYCLNVVTARTGFPAAVLVRAVEPVSSIKEMARNRHLPSALYENPRQRDLFKLASGPGKLCQAFLIDKELNGEDLTSSRRLFIEPGGKVGKSDIVATERIGVDYAADYKNKKWRFYLKNDAFVSKC